MQISYNTAPGNLRLDIGYGQAGFNIVNSLKELGHEVPYDDKKCPVQINFCQPNWYHLRDDQYQIGYTPWESSEIPASWPAIIEKCDEFWTTSERCKQWYLDGGVNKDIKVYKHGVRDIWKPHKRERKDVLRFLHIGEPAPRKGGQLAFDAFRAAFGQRNDVHLTIKAFAESTVRVKDREGNIIAPMNAVKNVTLDTRVIPDEYLPSYYNQHHVLIYPSFGEGFGLIPLQGVATGMPSVVPTWWCPYEQFVLPLDYKVGPTPWLLQLHGEVCHPSFDHLVELYRDIEENFSTYSDQFYERAPSVHEEFNWVKLTEEAFKDIAQKFA